jgi:hypothetical protein
MAWMPAMRTIVSTELLVTTGDHRTHDLPCGAKPNLDVGADEVDCAVFRAGVARDELAVKAMKVVHPG